MLLKAAESSFGRISAPYDTILPSHYMKRCCPRHYLALLAYQIRRIVKLDTSCLVNNLPKTLSSHDFSRKFPSSDLRHSCSWRCRSVRTTGPSRKCWFRTGTCTGCTPRPPRQSPETRSEVTPKLMRIKGYFTHEGNDDKANLEVYSTKQAKSWQTPFNHETNWDFIKNTACKYSTYLWRFWNT